MFQSPISKGSPLVFHHRDILQREAGYSGISKILLGNAIDVVVIMNVRFRDVGPWYKFRKKPTVGFIRFDFAGGDGFVCPSYPIEIQTVVVDRDPYVGRVGIRPDCGPCCGEDW